MNIEILKMPSLFATEKEIVKVEREKTRLENEGYNLICSTAVSSTYAKGHPKSYAESLATKRR